MADDTNQHNDIDSKITSENQAADWFNEYETQTYNTQSSGFFAFLFQSKLFLPIAIAAVVIVLLSIIWALLPSGDSQESANTTGDSSEQEQRGIDGTLPDDATDVDEDGGSPDDLAGTDGSEDEGYSEDYVDGGTEGASFDREDIDEESYQGPIGDDEDDEDPWAPIIGPCPAGQTGVRPNCVKPCPPGQIGPGNGNCRTPAPAPKPITLISRQTFAPSDYLLTANTTVKNIPAGTNAGTTVYLKGKKIATVTELVTYSNGKKFYVTEDQKAHGSKTGFLAETLKKVPAPAPAPNYKMIVIIDENRNHSTAFKGMPYVREQLAKKYSYAKTFLSFTNANSYPNYLVLATGSNFGLVDNIDYKPIPNASTVFGQAYSVGKTAKVYAESMKGTCNLNKSGAYVSRHNPWPWFSRETTLCKKYNVTTTQLHQDIAANKLPNISLVVPNNANNSHDGPLIVADNWVKALVPKLMGTQDWKDGKLIIVTTFDEGEGDSRAAGNILTTVAHPSLKNKVVTAKGLSLYSLARSYSEITGGKCLNKACSAPSLLSAFGLSGFIKKPPTPTKPPTTPTVGSINLKPWKLTLPINSGGGLGGSAAEIKGRDLTAYIKSPWYIPVKNAAKKLTSVKFYAVGNGATTSSSGNPRSELREMNSSGSNEYNWNPSKGVHRMLIKQKVYNLTGRKHVVIGQIHDVGKDIDDYTVFRLENNQLWMYIDGKKSKSKLLDGNVRLNQVITVGFSVENGVVKYYYSPTATSSPALKGSVRYPSGTKGAYFKAGSYCQCGTGKGYNGSAGVEIFGLGVSHNGTWPKI